MSPPWAANKLRQSTKILLIENDKQEAELFKRTLDDLKYDIHIETIDTLEGAEAALKEKEADTDLVVVNCSLPGTSGLETVSKLLTVTKIPIIIFTGDYNPEVAYWSGRLGAVGYLTKSMISYPEGVAHISCVLGRAVGENEKREKRSLAMRNLIQRINQECSLDKPAYGVV